MRGTWPAGVVVEQRRDGCEHGDVLNLRWQALLGSAVGDTVLDVGVGSRDVVIGDVAVAPVRSASTICECAVGAAVMLALTSHD